MNLKFLSAMPTHMSVHVFVPSFTEIPPVNEEKSRHVKYLLMDGRTDRRTDGRLDIKPENIMLSACYCWKYSNMFTNSTIQFTSKTTYLLTVQSMRV